MVSVGFRSFLDLASTTTVMFLDVLYKHIMTSKSLNLLSPQEEEWISSSSGDCKIYTSGTKANLQGITTEKNKNGAIAKVRISVENVIL